MYQFWLNTADADVGRFLKYFTFLSPGEIDDLVRQSLAAPEKRAAQRVLAEEVTALVHGEDARREAERTSQRAFDDDVSWVLEADAGSACPARCCPPPAAPAGLAGPEGRGHRAVHLRGPAADPAGGVEVNRHRVQRLEETGGWPVRHQGRQASGLSGHHEA